VPLQGDRAKTQTLLFRRTASLSGFLPLSQCWNFVDLPVIHKVSASNCSPHGSSVFPAMMESRFGLTPLRRCIEGLRLAEEIGSMPDTQWFVERVINTYTASFGGGEYVDQMRLLEALRIVWSHQCGGRGLILDYISQRERAVRDKGPTPVITTSMPASAQASLRAHTTAANQDGSATRRDDELVVSMALERLGYRYLPSMRAQCVSSPLFKRLIGCHR